jgi:7-keto-8-aminopelargonate synthetase-like enzyme
MGFDTAGSQTAVVPVVVGADATALAMVQRLHEEGVFVNCVISPATAPASLSARCASSSTTTPAILPAR